jgi:hypothetical protein
MDHKNLKGEEGQNNTDPDDVKFLQNRASDLEHPLKRTVHLFH